MAAQAAAAPGHRTIPVLGMRPGDHAFAQYDDDEDRWGILMAFAHLGLAAGEKVTVLADPAVPTDEVRQRLRAYNPAAEPALSRGQLTLTSMRDLIRPDRRFTARRQMDRLREETHEARRQGYTAFRTVIDMAWVEDLGMDVEGVMHRETHADALFADRRYAEICTYDRRRFAPEVIEAMRTGHPVALLDRLGALRTEHADDTLRVIGDADAATRPQLEAALDAAFARSTRLRVDLTGLVFLDAGCAASLLRAAGAAGANSARTEITCGPTAAAVLRLLGAESVAGIDLVEMAVT